MATLSNEVRLVLSSHLAFYYRHPWLLALFISGLSLGSALLTAIAGLNQEAQSRFEASAALLTEPVTYLIKPLTGKQYIDGEVWLELRRSGITQAQPVLRGTVKTEQGRSLSIQGVNTLLWLKAVNASDSQPQTQQFTEEWSFLRLLVDEQFASRIVSDDGQSIPLSLPVGYRQPEIRLTSDIGLWALTDLATADYLLGANGQLSFIELSAFTDKQADQINLIVAGKAQLVEAANRNFTVLSEAFFFNLSALALLGYIVAAFLSFNAIKLTLSSRKTLLQQMHLLGCSKQGIRLALIIELISVSLFTAIIGALCGYLIANALVLDLNRTLVGLYQFDKTLVIVWQWSKVALGFALNLSALTVIMVSQTPLVQQYRRWAFYSCLAVSLGAGIWLLNEAATDYQALLLCLCILMLFVLIVPSILRFTVTLPLTFSNPLAQWLHADSRFHLKDLHIAIVAMVVALGSAISMQIMVNSFAVTLDRHLETQLSADIYLRTDTHNADLRKALSSQSDVALVSIYQQSEGYIDSIPATLESYGDDNKHYQHISLTSGGKVGTSHFAQQGCLANEQAAIKYGLQQQNLVSFVQNDQQFNCRISGFFYDYGNPGIRLLTREGTHNDSHLNQVFIGYSIRLANSSSLDRFSERLVNEFKQDSTQIYPNERFKRYASILFNDTFVVTRLLNGFILAVALASLGTSLLSLSAGQLKQLSILHNLGVSRRQLLVMKLTQTTLIILLTIALTLPLGLALGIALLKFVMPIAFGWTIHFNPDIQALILTCLTLLAVAALCAYLPIRKLTRRVNAK
ncbi:ABC transporter permease [Alteromonas sp. MYP5]|uniref:ABC transporter permease n=2 Tax=Alteromonas ponticola TaxID=2720613 RepID=A0ABX1R091_9ALTE|nr:ABC transporter permease [Alteromonas ponticola]